jgi:hypothetical protein
MRSMLFRSGVVVAAFFLLGVSLLMMARRLVELVDGVATVRVANLSPSPFGWNGTWLQFGPPIGEVRENLVGRMPGIDPQFRSLDLTGPGPQYGLAAQITVNTAGTLTLSSDIGEHDLPEFAAEPGDSASLVIERSALAWPTPFEMNVVGMGGTATTWKRYVYYRLSWAKASGARLNMLWAGEQPYDGVNLWRAPGSFLVKVDIH